MSSTKQYIQEISLKKPTAKKTNDEMIVAVPSTQTPISLNRYQTKDCRS